MRLQGCQLPLLLLVLISPWPLTPSLGKFRSGFRSLFASAAFVNFTIDDTSSLIVYSPASNWRPSTTACSTCLGPDPKLAYATTWHDGTHIIPTVDSDDLPPGQSDLDDTNPTTHSTSSTRAPVPTHSGGANKQKGKGKGGGDDDDDEDSDHSGGKGDGDDKKSGNDNDKRDTAAVRSARHLSARDDSDGDDNPFFTEKGDSDDPGFVDQPVSLSFNFTGSAVYVYALVPLFTAASNTTPTFVNLTYTLDSQPSGNYLHTGSPSVQSSPTAYLSSFPVFQRTGLPDTPHTLTVNVGPDSVFLLDYIVYTQDSELGEVPNDPPSSGLTGSTSGSQPTTSVGPASPTAAMSQYV
ncbi:hypothetical protein BDW22DRAFT_1348337 [Trametopsis cervina]|nr:hypothetical protein BDW22DRAFT_1348337 [Trametopsis cervina]